MRVQVGATIIDFPTSGTDANWAAAVDLFVQAVADQLSTISNPYDIPNIVQKLTADANNNLILSQVLFDHTLVRSFTFIYGLFRTNTVTSLAEAGTVTGVYDTLLGSWTIQHEFEGDRQASTGLPYNIFSMSGDRLTLTTVPINGSYDSNNSRITFSAKTEAIATS